MTILCGTDFSAHAGDALRVAAALAKRSREELLLLHVSAFLGWQGRDGEADSAGRSRTQFAAALEEVRRDLERRLEHESKTIEPSGVTLSAELLQGMPDEVLVARAEASRARLIVIAALGRRSAKVWKLGGTADRVTERAKVPVLVVRRAQALERWLESREPLRIVLGVDDSASCEVAAAGLVEFVAASPCKITGVHVYWPPEQHAKQGSHGAVPLGSGHVEVERDLRTQLERRVSTGARGASVELQLIGGLGRTADHLVRIASELQADLIVVGNHQRTGFEKFWHGSVSHGVIDRSEANVLCVPTSKP